MHIENGFESEQPDVVRMLLFLWKDKLMSGSSFENIYPNSETFEKTLQKLEDEISARYGNQPQSRFSISSRFFHGSMSSTAIGWTEFICYWQSFEY